DGVSALPDPGAMVERKIGDYLNETAGPHDRRLHDALALAEPEEQLLRVLGDEARTGLHDSRGAALVGLDRHTCPPRIAVALGPNQSKRQRAVAGSEVVTQQNELRRGA